MCVLPALVRRRKKWDQIPSLWRHILPANRIRAFLRTLKRYKARMQNVFSSKHSSFLGIVLEREGSSLPFHSAQLNTESYLLACFGLFRVFFVLASADPLAETRLILENSCVKAPHLQIGFYARYTGENLRIFPDFFPVFLLKGFAQGHPGKVK